MIGPRGRGIIKESEGLRLTAYVCPAGKLTIGWGHTFGVYPGQVITEPEAEAFLEQDLSVAETEINSLITAKLTQAMRDALASWVFNLGGKNLRISTLRRKLNQQQYESVPDEIRRWTFGRVDGKMEQLPGLVTRREKEAQLFLADGVPAA